MSTLDSTSTRTQIIAAYADNASYQEGTGSTTKAQDFITACRLLLSPGVNFKRSKGADSQEIELDLSFIRQELTAALSWASAHDESAGGTSVSHFSFQNFRG